MTAATSSKARSFFGTRFRNDVAGNKKLLIVNIVLQTLGLPVISVIGLIMAYLETLENTDANMELQNVIEAGCIPFGCLGLVTFCVSLFLGMIIAMFHFSYLYKKSITDMNYALPLSGTQRFFADFLSGLTVYIAPFIGAVILSVAILGIGTPFLPLKDFWESFPIILQALFIILTAMILYYSLSVLAISFCGNTFEAIFSIISFNCLIPAAIACVWMAMCNSETYGIDSAAIMMKNIFTSTSPIGSISFFANYVAEAEYYSNSFNYYRSLYFKWIIITLAVSMLYTLAAYLLCRFRKAEDVSKPYVYKTAFYAIMTMAVFCVLSLFISLGAFLGAGIVICAVGWFIMEVITRRGFKKFWQAGIGFAASVISVLLICQLCKVTNGFGIAKSVPSSISIESVSIRAGDFIDDYNDIRYRDKDVIKASIELQKELIDRHFNFDDYEYETIESEKVNNALFDNNEITFNYSTLTGSSILRTYSVPSGMAGDLVKAILLSDEYARAVSENIGYYYESEETYSIDIQDSLFNHSHVNVTIENINDLRKAYYNDLSDMTEVELIAGDVYCYVEDLWVLSSFKNTINLLESLGISFNEINNGDIDFNKCGYIQDPVFTNYAEEIFKPKEEKNPWDYSYTERKYSLAESITSVNVKFRDYSYANRLIWKTDNVIDVVDKCTPIVIGEKPIAVFFINGGVLYLPDRDNNKELLDNLHQSSSDKITDSRKKIDFTVGVPIDGSAVIEDGTAISAPVDENGWD